MTARDFARFISAYVALIVFMAVVAR